MTTPPFSCCRNTCNWKRLLTFIRQLYYSRFIYSKIIMWLLLFSIKWLTIYQYIFSIHHFVKLLSGTTVNIALVENKTRLISA